MTAFLQSDGFQITAVIALIVVIVLWAKPPRDPSRYETIQTPSGAGRVLRKRRRPY